MYAADLINKDNKVNKFYFAKAGRQVALIEYADCFYIQQNFGDNKTVKYSIGCLDTALTRLKNGAQLIETIRYK